MTLVDNCIFCKIAKGDIPSIKIWEDSEYYAFLDLFPNTVGMTLVIPKKHFGGYAFDMPDGDYNGLMGAAKKVSKLLEKGLNVRRVAMVMEGTAVDHTHIKLYPLHGFGLNSGIKSEHKVWFDLYEGHISTKMGPQRSIEELKQIAKLIEDKNKNK